ncbi:translationally-controlled tumor protein homolog isoform X1 [Entelurus aequoreus]|uniref:translationally-controlled tumor protein homolog isoform X1 n=2 Tax=Entelurus aequoreus TaxID=161455 RepID=UPI002B1E2DAC|nr:translationally-controlled tumor protein homolog isoform X1 [Entelurus aequoreus]
MIIYRDIISNDELFTDVYKITDTPIFYEVEGKHITMAHGDIDGSLIGANASAEEAAEGTDSSSVSGIDVVLHNKLQQTTFDKKSYMGYIKEYMKKIRANLEKTNPERLEKFMADSNSEIKKLIPEIKNLQFFTGESMNPDGMVVILDYREDQVTPFLRFFRDGLVEEKC